ncbi:hypothetical protein JCM10212_002991 [Sporobolomyces blumeae]
MLPRAACFVLWASLARIHLSTAFYLPGSAPSDYRPGEPVPLLVNSLKNYDQAGAGGINGMVIFDGYDKQFGFCRPEHLESQPSSLGSALFGDRLYNSAFDLRMARNSTCQTLCRTQHSVEQSRMIELAADTLGHDWLIDGLPLAEVRMETSTGRLFYSPGFPIGSSNYTLAEGEDGWLYPQNQTWTLNNHFRIIVEYHPRPKQGVNRVVGAVVQPMSIDSLRGGKRTPDCGVSYPYRLEEGKAHEVAYTYDVVWKESATPWATRWDLYLTVLSPRIHVLSLVNSIVVALFLCLLVGMVFLRVLNRDITRYNALATYDLDFDGAQDSVQEDYGWKLLHGEVGRAPKYRMWLCVVVGSGAQLTAMVFATLFFALLGFLSPSNRGGLSTVMIVCWTLFGFIAGYVSSRLYLTFGGTDIRKCIFYTATVFPTALFAFLFVLNFFLIGAKSAGAVPFGTFMAIAGLWFGINVPLGIIGGWVGIKRGGVETPLQVNAIPRQVPPTSWWLNPLPSALLAGVLPFGAGFIETYFVLQSLFGSKSYYAFGYLALASCVVAITTALTSILMAYFHLCAENYHWQWRSILTGGSSAFYLFLYSLIYWATKLNLPGLTNKVLYLSYVGAISGLVFVVNGTVGFVSVAWFLRVIYYDKATAMMLQRARGFDHNQENPQLFAPHHTSTHPPLHHHLNPTKTPARPGKGSAAAPPVTGGKGPHVLNTAARGVLGRKDGNLGGGANPTGTNGALLFPGPSKSTTASCSSSSAVAGPSTSQSHAPFKTPAPKPRSLRPLADLQTPATALRPKRAPVLVPSPEVEVEDEVETDVAEGTRQMVDMGDVEVEYAGKSALDYEEPFETGFDEPNYKNAGYGAALRGMSLGGFETHEEWEERDRIERASFEFETDTVDLRNEPEQSTSDALLPVPKASRRVPLAAKPANRALTTSGRSTSSTARKPAPAPTASLRRPALQPSTSAPAVPSRRLLASSTRPISTLSKSTATMGPPKSTTTTRRPLQASTSRPGPGSSRPASALSSSSLRSKAPLQGNAVGHKPSVSSLRATISTSSSSARPAVDAAAQRRHAELEQARLVREEERKLGAFGIVDEDEDGDGDGLGRLVDVEGMQGVGGFADEEASFELDLSFD